MEISEYLLKAECIHDDTYHQMLSKEFSTHWCKLQKVGQRGSFNIDDYTWFQIKSLLHYSMNDISTDGEFSADHNAPENFDGKDGRKYLWLNY